MTDPKVQTIADMLHAAFDACVKPDAKPLAIAKVAARHPEVTPQMVREVFSGEHSGTVSAMATAVIAPQVYVDAMAELALAKAETSSKSGEGFYMFAEPASLRSGVIQMIKDGSNLPGQELAKTVIDDAALADEPSYRVARVKALLKQASEQLAKISETGAYDTSEAELALQALKSLFAESVTIAEVVKKEAA